MARSNGPEPSSMEKDEFPIRAYSIKELAGFYRVSTKVFRKWIAMIETNIGPRIGHLYNPAQVKVIVQHLGKPFTWLIAIIVKSLFGWADDGGDGQEEGQKMGQKG